MQLQSYILRALCGLALTVIPASPAGITLAVNPLQSSVAVNGTTEVDLTISGLSAMSAPSLSAFDLNLNFDPAFVSVASTLFGSSSTPFDQLDIGGAGSLKQENQPSVGDLHLIEVSLDSPNVLDSQQQGSFTLAEIGFRGLHPGTAALSLSVNTLGDSQGNPLSATTVTNANLSVTAGTATPEPASLALLASGTALIIALALYKRRLSLR